MPVWLRLIGISPLVTGALLALRPLLSFLLTPLVGHIVHGSNRRAVRVGGLLILAGWLWLALTLDTVWMLLPAFGLLVVGGNLITTAEIGRWYKLRSPAGIIARESAITLGRCPVFEPHALQNPGRRRWPPDCTRVSSGPFTTFPSNRRVFRELADGQVAEFAMPSEQEFLLYPLDTDEDPVCLSCGTLMVVAAHEARETKPDFITFRCINCGRSEKFLSEE